MPLALARAQVAVLLAAGVVGAAGVVAVAIAARSTADLGAAAVPAGFCVAGGLGGLARPDHPGTRLLALVGACHLVAFALSGWAAISSGPDTTRWALEMLATAVYVAGFAALAVVLACSPNGRPASRLQRGFAAATIVLDAVAVLDLALLHARLDLLDGVRAGSVPAPAPLPVLATTFDPILLVVLPVPLALVVLAVSGRRMDDRARRALGWDVLAAAVLAMLLIASPAADVLAPGAWDLVFPVGASVVPFLLLAGLLRARLLEVDVYVVRTLARGTAALVVLGLVGTAVAIAGTAAGVAVAAALAVLAVVAGVPVLRVLERLADRLTTSGRIADRRMLDDVAAALNGTARADIPRRACEVVTTAFDAAWVRIDAGVASAAVGSPAGPTVETVTLEVAGEGVGVLEVGPRRGGWAVRDRRRLERIAGRIALLIREAALTALLADQVAALTASRLRLVEAEDTARRRMERDLHDGAQQQLVALLARITVARAQTPEDAPAAGTLEAAHELARQALQDLRDLVNGFAPPLLGDRGLVAAIESRAARLPITVTIDADPRLADERLPEPIEGAAFFVVAEALANVMKHAITDRARVVLAAIPDGIRLAVADDGTGEADARGSGIQGLRDRVEALGGRFTLVTTPGVGTTVVAELPLEPVGFQVRSG